MNPLSSINTGVSGSCIESSSASRQSGLHLQVKTLTSQGLRTYEQVLKTWSFRPRYNKDDSTTFLDGLFQHNSPAPKIKYLFFSNPIVYGDVSMNTEAARAICDNSDFYPSVQSPIDSRCLSAVRSQFIHRGILGKCDASPEFQHVTYLNLGSVESIVQALRCDSVCIEPRRVKANYLKLFERFAELPSEQLILDVDNVSVHKETNKLEVWLEKTDRYVANRRPWVESVEDFIRGFGVGDVDKFMVSHPKMRYIPEDRHQPHVTLGRTIENYNSRQELCLNVDLDVPRIKVHANFGLILWIPRPGCQPIC